MSPAAQGSCPVVGLGEGLAHRSGVLRLGEREGLHQQTLAGLDGRGKDVDGQSGVLTRVQLEGGSGHADGVAELQPPVLDVERHTGIATAVTATTTGRGRDAGVTENDLNRVFA